MAESRDADPVRTAHAKLDDWHARLRAIDDELKSGERLFGGLGTDPATNVYEDLHGKLSGVAERARRVVRRAQGMQEMVETLESEWIAARRWKPAGLADLERTLAGEFNDRPAVARHWLTEIFDALDAQEWEAVTWIAAADLPWSTRFLPGVKRIRSCLEAWCDGEVTRGMQLMLELGGPDGIEHWGELPKELRSRAHKLAAWIAQQALDDRTVAMEHLDDAVALSPEGGRMLAERAAFRLYCGDFEDAESDAQQAVELGGESGTGYLELGMWSELTGEFDAGDDLYERGLRRMPSFDIIGLSRRVAFIDPPGRLLARAAEELQRRGHREAALQLADDALLANIRGAEQHPQADVHSLRSRILEALSGRPNSEAADAALSAGERYLWNGEPTKAFEQFKRAYELDTSLSQAGWLRADALAAQSLPLGETRPRRDKITKAREVWDQQNRREPPKGETSWAYLTSAVIADLASQLPETDRAEGIWAALHHVERALVHDETDAQRWGYAAQYLRYAGLHALAIEATREGMRASPDDRRVLAERLVLLGLHGSQKEAEKLADRLEDVYGHDATVGAVRALLALRRDSADEALRLLELPVAAGSDQLWYRDMQALAELERDAPEAATAIYDRMLKGANDDAIPAIDGPQKCRVAAAAAMIGRRDDAHEWLNRASQDASTRDHQCQLALAYVGAAEGDEDAAGKALEQAIASARSAGEIGDVERDARLRLPLIAALGTEARERLEAAVEAAARERTDAVADSEPDPEQDLTDALADCGLPKPRASREGDPHVVTALLAVRARRLLRARALDEAADAYEKLRAAFDPEAGIALARVVKLQSAEHARHKRVGGVAAAQRRLVELGATTPADAAVAVARAHESAGDIEKALTTLHEQLAETTDDAERQVLHWRLAELSVRAGNTAAASEYVGTALELVRTHPRPNLLGQLEVMCAVVDLVEGTDEEVQHHLDTAYDCWSNEGASRIERLVVAEFLRIVDWLPDDAGLDPSGAANTIAAWWSKRAPLEEIQPLLDDLDGSA